MKKSKLCLSLIVFFTLILAVAILGSAPARAADPAGIDFGSLNQELGKLGFKFTSGTIGDIISALIPYIFVVAGLILFGYLIWGGFEFLTSAGDPEKIKTAQSKLVSAIVGFVIIFASYWLVQILEVVLGISILK